MPPDDVHKEEVHLVEDKHPELNIRLDNMMRAGMAVTNQWRVMWQVAMRYTWSQQLDTHFDLKDDWDYIVINKIYPLMMQNIAKLAKNNPKVQCFPWSVDANITQYTDEWAGLLQYLWESTHELGMRTKLITGLLDGGVFGYMVGKTIWDPTLAWNKQAQRNLGNVRHEFVHPGMFWADPTCERIDRRSCRNCGTRRKVTMEWAQYRWPEFADEIETVAFTAADPQYWEDSILGYREDSTIGELVIQNQRANESLKSKVYSHISKILQGSTANQPNMQQAGDTLQETQRYVYVEEFYFDDHDNMRELEVSEAMTADEVVGTGLGTMDPETGQIKGTIDGAIITPENWPKKINEKRRVSEFPLGRYCLRIGRSILNAKKEQQIYPYSRWPYQVMPYNILPHMWQGTPAAEMNRQMQDMLNLSVSALIQRARLAADPERLIEVGALARDRRGNLRQTKQQMRGIGKWIIMAQGKIDKMRDMQYAPLDPSEMLLVQTLAQGMNDNMFMQPVARGAPTKPQGGKDGKATATEINTAATSSHEYTAMQGTFLDAWIDGTLTLIAEIVQYNYTKDRVTRVLGAGNPKPFAITQQHLDVTFDVNIVPGSTLPFDQERQKQDHLTAYELMTNPMPNPMLETVLRDLNVPDVEKMLMQHEGTQVFLQFMQLSLQLQANPEYGQALLNTNPELGPVLQLMQQAAAIAPPEMKQAAEQQAAEQEQEQEQVKVGGESNGESK